MLKGLIEDGLLNLDDGRRIVARTESPSFYSAEDPDHKDIYIHKDFRLFVLANRPGYPFLGNDFFRESGDCFSSHIIQNPDATSQLQMLKAFAGSGNATELSIHRLISAFDELRGLYEEGVLSYPYSVRELVNVVKHMDRYPQDGIPAAIDNVLSWDGLGTGLKGVADDSISPEDATDAASVISAVLLRHGIDANDLRAIAQNVDADVTIRSRLHAVDLISSNHLVSISPPVICSADVHTLQVRNSGFKFGSVREVPAQNIVLTEEITKGSNERIRWKIGLYLLSILMEKSEVAIRNILLILTTVCLNRRPLDGQG